jgi:thymidylate kinase
VLGAQRRVGKMPRFRLANGGAIIGVMGGDGAGKSTAIDGLGSWLEKMFDVRRIHLGKPPWSATTYAVRGALKGASLVRSALPRALQGKASGGSDTEPGYRTMAWLACTARDRYLTYRTARRFANRGGLVLSDRYPHPALESMDVPLISRLSGPRMSGRVADALMRTEQHYHDRIELPEVLAVLMIDPESAATRKTDEPADYVKRRVAEVWQTDWKAFSVDIVDAGQPIEGVTAELKSLIWAALT